MIKHLGICFLICLFCVGCFEPDRFATISKTSPNSSLNEAQEIEVALDSVDIINGTRITLKAQTTAQLFLRANLSNGAVFYNITNEFQSSYTNLNSSVVWYSNNSKIATISASGKIQAKTPGKTNILATLLNKSATIEVIVQAEEVIIDQTPSESTQITDDSTDNSDENSSEISDETEQEDTTTPEETEPQTALVPEPADNPDDYFLGADDILWDNFAADSGFGYQNFPEILYGPPVGVYDVVSFGTSGELKIQFNRYVIVNGEGADFTVFENAFSGWEECASVSVSQDDQNWYDFECDQYNSEGHFTGCAGATPVNYDLSESDYLNPELSGGDVFDLSDLENHEDLEFVKYIKIKDIGRCLKNTRSSPNGFDLDAIAILNGINEE